MGTTVNKVTLVGRLGVEPDDRKGGEVVKLRIATSEWYNGSEHTTWHTVATFGDMANFAMRCLHKGSRVYIEGRIENRAWKDKNGEKHFSSEIIATNLIALDQKVKQDPKPADDDDIPF